MERDFWGDSVEHFHFWMKSTVELPLTFALLRVLVTQEEGMRLWKKWGHQKVAAVSNKKIIFSGFGYSQDSKESAQALWYHSALPMMNTKCISWTKLSPQRLDAGWVSPGKSLDNDAEDSTDFSLYKPQWLMVCKGSVESIVFYVVS